MRCVYWGGGQQSRRDQYRGFHRNGACLMADYDGQRSMTVPEKWLWDDGDMWWWTRG